MPLPLDTFCRKLHNVWDASEDPHIPHHRPLGRIGIAIHNAPAHKLPRADRPDHKAPVTIDKYGQYNEETDHIHPLANTVNFPRKVMR